MHITLKLGCSRLDHWVSAALGHQGPPVVCTVPPQRFWLSRARGAHGSLCPMDVSQPEGASVKRTQTAPSTSDPLCLQTPQLLQSCTVPRPDPDCPAPSLSAPGCGAITVWSPSCQEGDLGRYHDINTKRNLDFKRKGQALEIEPPTKCEGAASQQA